MSTFGFQSVYMHRLIGLCPKFDFVILSEFSLCPGLQVTEKNPITVRTMTSSSALDGDRHLFVGFVENALKCCPLEYRLRRCMLKKVDFQSD